MEFRIDQVRFDDFGKLWIATNGNGLIRLDKDSIDFAVNKILSKRVPTSAGIINGLLLVDSVAYASTPTGIERILFDEKSIMSVERITEENGLEMARINDLEYFNGDVYIAQDNGLFSFDHNQSFKETNDFPVVIDAVTAADSLYVVDQEMEFPHDIGLIQIKSKAINYRYQNSLEYQFRLLQGENDFEQYWNTSLDNEITFSNLSPGDYLFQFRAKSANSDWTPPVELSFNIQAAYWQTLWFKALIALLTIVLAYLIFYWINHSRKNKIKLSNAKKVSDLKALKAQINPHFLFNALNSIQSFVLGGNESLADDYLVKYGKLMRKILNHSNELTIYLNDELEAIRIYIELEQLRLQKGLVFDIKIDEAIDIYSTKVPSMIIQPLLENAIWHGIQPSDKEGKLLLKIYSHPEEIEIIVEDNGVGFDKNLKI